MKALVVGRFQPFHTGHLRMLEYVAKREGTLVIGVGSSNKSSTKENPFTVEERKEMIRKSVPFKNYVFAEIPDFGDNLKWVAWIKDNVEFDVAYTNSERERKIFENAGIAVKPIPFFEREKYSAIEVRRRIASGLNWRELVSKGTLEVMEKTSGAERVRKLSEPK
ncbi:MAG: nicotinamide-nucleotide adenylyltransferase [Candidatus Altiarchaeota archaeon]|nr:nicotinamide-nucleotide adenylyltransferase [Candidatus Altiarchaeota archaeon]